MTQRGLITIGVITMYGSFVAMLYRASVPVEFITFFTGLIIFIFAMIGME